MSRRLLIVVGAPLCLGAILAIPIALAIGTNQLAFAAIAFGLSVPPGLAVVLLHDYLIRTSPFGRVMALFVGTFIRLVVGFGGGVILFLLVGPEERTDKLAFWAWILFAYLTTLATETVVFAQQAPGRMADGRQ